MQFYKILDNYMSLIISTHIRERTEFQQYFTKEVLNSMSLQFLEATFKVLKLVSHEEFKKYKQWDAETTKSELSVLKPVISE